MPLPTGKVKEILLEYHSMCKLESSHMQTSIASTLPIIRPWADCQYLCWFWKCLSMIMKHLKHLTLLRPSIVSHLCRSYSNFKDFALWASTIFSKTKIAVTSYHSLHRVNSKRFIEMFSHQFQNKLVVSKLLIHWKWYKLCLRFFGPLPHQKTLITQNTVLSPFSRNHNIPGAISCSP